MRVRRLHQRIIIDAVVKLAVDNYVVSFRAPVDACATSHAHC